mmetsp:Transcript_86857/g.274200  ORF Transcript_86857/g.274200 Transcript_86857/m.274200 type:complete len:495 (+) Transcript_86857:1079-2563(+)
MGAARPFSIGGGRAFGSTSGAGRLLDTGRTAFMLTPLASSIACSIRSFDTVALCSKSTLLMSCKDSCSAAGLVGLRGLETPLSSRSSGSTNSSFSTSSSSGGPGARSPTRRRPTVRVRGGNSAWIGLRTSKFRTSSVTPPLIRITNLSNCGPSDASASRRRNSEYACSFQSCGISCGPKGRALALQIAGISRSISLSTRNLASTVARASSRRWWTTLFLSAIRSKYCVKDAAYLSKGWSCLVTATSSNLPSGPRTCSRASTAMTARGSKAPLLEMQSSALRITNHSRPVHSFPRPSSSNRSMQLLMPRTGWGCSPMETSLRYTSAWNMTSPTLDPSNQAGWNFFVCSQRSRGLSSALGTGSREKTGARPSIVKVCMAKQRYSRFTEAAGSSHGARRTEKEPGVRSESTKQHRPGELSSSRQPMAAAGLWFGVTASRLQPMPNSLRHAAFAWASCSLLASSCCHDTRKRSSERHSPCTGPGARNPASWLSSPNGN